MAIRLDEVLELLPETGLALGYMAEHTCGTWGVMLVDSAYDVQKSTKKQPRPSYWGQGSSPLEAIGHALSEAGFNIEDDA